MRKSSTGLHGRKLRHVRSQAHVRLQAFYRCVLNEGTDREVDTDWFPNLITNQGLDRLGQGGGGVLIWGSIGTGTTTPANADTALQAVAASTNNMTLVSQSNSGASAYQAQSTTQYSYAQGAVVGNMAEVGVGWATGGVSLFSRARILDGSGSPTTLTCTSIDQLTVYYKVVATPSLTDITGSVSLSGTSYAYTARPALISNFASLESNLQASAAWGAFPSGTVFAFDSTAALGAITAGPSGTQVAAAATCSSPSYTVGNYYNDTTFTLAPSVGNPTGGIGAMMFGYQGGQNYFQYAFTTVIPKDSTKTLTLTLRFSWGR